MKKITTFWNYFQKNEETIKNAILLGINTNEVFSLFERKLDYISKRIGYIIMRPSEDQGKYDIIFTANGYRKLFPKIIALENQAPKLEHFTAQAFIKPLQDVEKYINGTDEPWVWEN